MVIFSQNFKDVRQSSCLSGLWWEIYSHFSHHRPARNPSFCWKASRSFSLSLVFSSFAVMYLGVVLFAFILFGSADLESISMYVFHQIWEIFSRYFFKKKKIFFFSPALVPFSYSSWTQVTHTRPFSIILPVFGAFFPLFILLCVCSLEWVISTVPYLSPGSRVPLSFPFCLLTSLVNLLLHMLYFSVLKFFS